MSEVKDEAGTGSSDTNGGETGASAAGDLDSTAAGADASAVEAGATAAAAPGATANVDATAAEPGAAVTPAKPPVPADPTAAATEAAVGATGATETGPTAVTDETVTLAAVTDETVTPAGSPGATDSPVAAAGTDARPAPSRRLVTALAATSAVLVLLAVVLAVGWARSSGELAERQRAQAAARAEQDRLRAELDAVVARRGQLERDLAAAQAQALDPQSRAAIEKCVREYAEYERLMREIVATGSLDAPAGVEVKWVTVGPGGISVSSSCTEAATRLGL